MAIDRAEASLQNHSGPANFNTLFHLVAPWFMSLGKYFHLLFVNN
jgi:hypothetical protein